ncbi:hypothetical protein GRI62_03710 [Erythrobacter arachoides]|uniref:Polymerase nucleotidyl transferase domain-containing protein n=1 Tax=Aurantiacibacter arachoides TaxID=1850444 RepID=A0A844ZX70_9SPHN|nr:nucleotidyltransferase domain-containing protein [Aurantiacibacter arachoides]MXO92713.1 hypothetical protein [Aurantiacibacter arachoides]
MMGKIFGFYLIGSVARNEFDALSDLDLLAIVQDGAGKVDEKALLSFIPDKYAAMDASVSWYGRRRINEMLKNGELFAWHIWQEHIALFESNGFSLRGLGPPRPYKNSLVDVRSFRKILREVPGRLRLSPTNVIYEFGLIYVCLRNIAMSASAKLCDAPDFSRYSPFRINLSQPLPMTRECYEKAMMCRMAGQRGLSLPDHPSADEVISLYEGLESWLSILEERLEQ